MSCFNTLCMPFIFLSRCIVSCTPCCFKTHAHFKEPFDIQLQLNRNRKGGYYTDYYATRTSTRDCFYTFLALAMRRKSTKPTIQFVERLAEYMTTSGQVPCMFVSRWYTQAPEYHQNDIKVIDANMFFIIMVWQCYDEYPDRVEKLYLSCQRAFEWLQTYTCNSAIFEPMGASWEYTRKHKGHMLLSNVIMIQTIRCMELLACVLRDERQQRQFKEKHDKALTKWVPEIYKSQETLPRILAVHWNMVPREFIVSFNQELQCSYVPLRTAGPVKDVATWNAWVYGRDDLHTEIIWPWIGLLWICVLVQHSKRKIAQRWWTAYMEYHQLPTLHDIYSKETHLPIRRAFLKGMPAHSLTLSMHMAAHQLLHGTPV